MERRPGLDIRTRLVLAGAAFLAAGGLKFGSGQGPEVVHAETSTTPTPIGTATPDAGATQIAGAYATGTALARELDQAEKLATVQAANAAIQERLDALHGTPTRTPTPTITGTPTSTFTPTPTFTKEQREIKEQAGILLTDTPTPGPWPTEAVPPESNGGKDKNREIPWGSIAGGAIVLTLVGGVYVASRIRRNRAE